MDRIIASISVEHDVELEHDDPQPWDVATLVLALVLVLITLACCATLLGWAPGWVQ